MDMRFGFYTPNFDYCGDARTLAELAADAEAAGWDGFFLWDHLQLVEPTADPWVALTAMALATRHIRLGTLVTPLPRRHIGKLAREVLTLDHLSGGRIVLGVGAGYAALPDYVAFGDERNAVERAAKLDEGLQVLSLLLSGAGVNHRGGHYRVECEPFTPPVQRPRVPIWVAATWPLIKPLRRAARWDGVVASSEAGLELKAEDLQEVANVVRRQRDPQQPFEVVTFGQTVDSQDTTEVEMRRSAGATWWMEYIFTGATSLEQARARIRRGPPRVSR